MCVFSTEFLKLIQFEPIMTLSIEFHIILQNGLIWNPSELQNDRKLRFLLKKHIFSLKKVCFLGRISNCEHESSWCQRNPLCHIKLCKIHKIYTPPELKKALKLPQNAVFSKKTCILILRGTPRDQIFPKWK